MNKKIVIALLAIMFVSTGCTQQLKNSDGKVIQYEQTGQTLTSNILCRPNDEEIVKVYKENGVDTDKLPTCSEFSITSGGYEGIWTTIFIKPLAFLIIKLGELVNNYGLAIMLLGILIRLALMPVTKKTAMQSENLKIAQPELAKLEEKYRNKVSKEDQLRKSQEMMGIYKKYSISPLSGCLFALIQLPLFIAFLEAINRVPAVFENHFLTLQLGTTPLAGLAKGNYAYLILVVLIAVATYFSFKLNKTATPSDTAGMPNMKYMMIGMIVIIVFSSFNFPAAIALYWVATSTFTIVQNLWVKRQREENPIIIKK